MFSLQQFFGKGDRFLGLLESAAQEAHDCVKLTVEIVKVPGDTKKWDELVLTRRKERKIFEQINTELVRTFVTGLEREDIEALARCLYRIPKAAEKLAGRFIMAKPYLEGLDLSRQADLMIMATDGAVAMVGQLRHINDLEKVKELNDPFNTWRARPTNYWRN
jgi:uncharacterized protein